MRQEDGLLLICRDYPGSIVDVTQCSEMIDLIPEKSMPKYDFDYQTVLLKELINRTEVSWNNTVF